MTPEQKVAYVMAQTTAATIEMESMKVANHDRRQHGQNDAYGEKAFIDLIIKYGVHHNAVIGLFHDL